MYVMGAKNFRRGEFRRLTFHHVKKKYIFMYLDYMSHTRLENSRYATENHPLSGKNIERACSPNHGGGL